MDFVMGLPLSASKKNAVWVIVGRLTKSTHFIPIHDTWGVEKLAQLYVKEIVRLHSTPKDIGSRPKISSSSLASFAKGLWH